MRKIIGKCKQCGACCLNIRLEMTDSFRPDINVLNNDLNKQVNDFISTHIKINPFIDFSKIDSIEFRLVEPNRIKLIISPLSCNHLKKAKGKYLCGIHNKKPSYCENHPNESSMILDGCGFEKIEIKKKE